MSVVGILSNSLLNYLLPNPTPTTNPTTDQNFQTELQQLGENLASGNRTAAQSDRAAVQQDLRGQVSGATSAHSHHHHVRSESFVISFFLSPMLSCSLGAPRVLVDYATRHLVPLHTRNQEQR